jgi:hypothetical protein
MMAGLKQPKKLYCGICSKKFTERSDLQQHQLHHEETKLSFVCETCAWPFDDSIALSKHQSNTGHSSQTKSVNGSQTKSVNGSQTKVVNGTQMQTGNTSAPEKRWCERCPPAHYGGKIGSHVKAADFQEHRKFPNPCSDSEWTKRLKEQRALPTYKDAGLDYGPPLDPPPLVQRPVPTPPPTMMTVTSLQQSIGSTNAAGGHCHVCQKSFPSLAVFNKHFLACRPALPTPIQQSVLANNRSTQDVVSNQIKCLVVGCTKTFRTERALRYHQTEAHGIGDNLNIYGKAREDLISHGLLHVKSHPDTPPSRSRQQDSITTSAMNGYPPTMRGPPPTMRGPPPTTRGPPLTVRGTPPTMRGTTPSASPYPTPYIGQQNGSSAQVASTVTNPSVGGLEDEKQANDICGKMMRLALQTDMIIKPNGEMTYGAQSCFRIPVNKQKEAVISIGDLCHLRVAVQAENHVPSPRTFQDENAHHYAVEEFKTTPNPLNEERALKVVAIACSKVLLTTGCQEIVKLAAVDIITGRILMSNLVCTNAKMPVKEWRTTMTGLTSFHDIEAGRQQGYKVFKGWEAARAALFKFVDKQTVIVGHNLRNDLDALRIVHGRAIDVAKLAEKAAGGPMSKQQLSLETLSRELTSIKLATHPNFGRDCLQNAFAIRQIVLWILKNPEAQKKWAKARSLEYQRLNPTAR